MYKCSWFREIPEFVPKLLNRKFPRWRGKFEEFPTLPQTGVLSLVKTPKGVSPNQCF